MTQLNTPYPSTAYLTGFLRSRGIDAHQEDLAIQLVLQLFSPPGLNEIRHCVASIPKKRRTPTTTIFDEAFDRYLTTLPHAPLYENRLAMQRMPTVVNGDVLGMVGRI